MPEIRPLPDDPGAHHVAQLLDTAAQDWILTTVGKHTTAAVEATRRDGTGFQRLVALEWPGRLNHSNDEIAVRLLMSPEDAVQLAGQLIHSAGWAANPAAARERAATTSVWRAPEEAVPLADALGLAVEEIIGRMTLAEVFRSCRDAGLPTTGNETTLRRRLINHRKG